MVDFYLPNDVITSLNILVQNFMLSLSNVPAQDPDPRFTEPLNP